MKKKLAMLMLGCAILTGYSFGTTVDVKAAAPAQTAAAQTVISADTTYTYKTCGNFFNTYYNTTYLYNQIIPTSFYPQYASDFEVGLTFEDAAGSTIQFTTCDNWDGFSATEYLDISVSFTDITASHVNGNICSYSYYDDYGYYVTVTDYVSPTQIVEMITTYSEAVDPIMPVITAQLENYWTINSPYGDPAAYILAAGL